MSEDDLTIQLCNTIKSNIALKDAIDKGESQVVLEQVRRVVTARREATARKEERSQATTARGEATSCEQVITQLPPRAILTRIFSLQLIIHLQHQVAAFMDNELRGQLQITTRSGRPLKTLVGRLKGKEGR